MTDRDEMSEWRVDSDDKGDVAAMVDPALNSVVEDYIAMHRRFIRAVLLDVMADKEHQARQIGYGRAVTAASYAAASVACDVLTGLTPVRAEPLTQQYFRDMVRDMLVAKEAES